MQVVPRIGLIKHRWLVQNDDASLGRSAALGFLPIIVITIVFGTYLSYSLPQNTLAQSPVQVVSVFGPIPPYNPGGPVVSVTLKNVGQAPIVSLNATLKLPSAEPSVTYVFTFEVSSSDPLLPGQSVEITRTLIGAGFGNSPYPLVISGLLSNGIAFNYTQQVRILQLS